MCGWAIDRTLLGAQLFEFLLEKVGYSACFGFCRAVLCLALGLHSGPSTGSHSVRNSERQPEVIPSESWGPRDS